MAGFVQGNTSTGVSAQSATISLTGVAAGNIIVVFAKIASASLGLASFNIADNFSNAYGAYATHNTTTNSSTFLIGISAILVTGGSITITVSTTGTAGAWELACGEYNGFTTFNSMQPTVNAQTQGTSTTALSASLTPTSPDKNNLFVGWCFLEAGGSRTFTAQATWTLREPPGTGNIAFQDKIVVSNAAITSTITISGANVAWSAGIIAITDSAGFSATGYMPSLLTPPMGHGIINKFGVDGNFNQINVPGANVTSTSGPKVTV